ncbi:hypothetical protein [Paenibacillus sp. S150]|uniref:hypothetical protein n=1 Tax=Paenibacillus sp. S150 TaxID=2749826 RepID=UPI001C56A0A4|nr:hypothetical protein [Paenibacillus sp. S150]MBW4085791.1 hypothetical protein [Paenibacillus sp. S150]
MLLISAQVGIRLRTEPLQAPDARLEAYRSIWNVRFVNLEDYLRQLQSENREYKER